MLLSVMCFFVVGGDEEIIAKCFHSTSVHCGHCFKQFIFKTLIIPMRQELSLSEFHCKEINAE